MGSESDGVIKSARCPECRTWQEVDWGLHMEPHGCGTDGISIADMFVPGGVQVIVRFGESQFKADKI